MERLVQCIISEGELDSEINTALASCLCVSFKDQLEGRIFPKEPNQEYVLCYEYLCTCVLFLCFNF